MQLLIMVCGVGFFACIPLISFHRLQVWKCHLRESDKIILPTESKWKLCDRTLIVIFATTVGAAVMLVGAIALNILLVGPDAADYIGQVSIFGSSR